jgi:hypothetical protein
MHPDHTDYFKYMNAARFDKSINTLLGILQGIAMDSRIDSKEIALLSNWLKENIELRQWHPFSELIPQIVSSLEDEYLDEDERLDLIWACEKLRSTEYYNLVTADIQCLHGIMAGIVSDGIITQSEIEGLSNWAYEHEHLRGCWPYDEVCSLITAVMADKRIDESEHQLLKSFFGGFAGMEASSAIGQPMALVGSSIKGLCAVCPEIAFQNSIFCFTGTSTRYLRKELAQIVEELKGRSIKSVTQELDYLVIGAGSNPCWAYACYGRKVEQAVALRKQGFKLILVHENDFHDAVADAKTR